MSAPASDFSCLMQRAAVGDQNACTELFHFYNPILLAQLRSRLKKIPLLRSLLDAEDLAQDIWIGFFTGALRRRQFPTSNNLGRYLARAASNQIRKVGRDHLSTQKRDARRNQSLRAAAVVADSAPSPAYIAEVRDECERWPSSLPDAQQQVIRLIGDGLSHAEITKELRCPVRAVERMKNEVHRAPAFA